MQCMTISRTRKWSFSFSYTARNILCTHSCSVKWDRFCIFHHTAAWLRHSGRFCSGLLPANGRNNWKICRNACIDSAENAELTTGIQSPVRWAGRLWPLRMQCQESDLSSAGRQASWRYHSGGHREMRFCFACKPYNHITLINNTTVNKAPA